MPAPDNRMIYEQIKASRQLGEGSLGLHRLNLQLAGQMPPAALQYDASALDKQATELGLGQIQRSKQAEMLTDPAAARMRAGMSEAVESATSGDELKSFMERWAKERGIIDVARSGIDPSSTIARSAFFDTATEAGRKRRLEDLTTRQAYLQQKTAPIGGIDVGKSLAAQEETKAANINKMNMFQQQQLQNIFGMNQSYSDFVNRTMGEASSAFEAANANVREYQKALINDILERNAAQNAATGAAAQGRQAQTGAIAGAGIAAAGTLGAAAIMI
jgi:hypothetical protein